MFQIAFRLTQQELVNGMLAIAKSRFGTKVSRVIGSLLLIASLILLVFDGMLNHRTSGFGWLFLLFCLFIRFYLDSLIWFQAKKLVKQNAPITESMTYTFNQTDYEFTGESFSTRMAYAKLYEVSEATDFILLKVSEATAHILPKRALSADEFARLKAIIQTIPALKSRFIS